MLYIGLGVTGKSLYNLSKKNEYHTTLGYDTNHETMINVIGNDTPPETEGIDILFIQLKYSKLFSKIVVDYARKYNPKVIAINSTVIPGTCMKIMKSLDIPVVHTPIRGQHDNMDEHLVYYSKWISGINNFEISMTKEYFESLGLKVTIASNAYNHPTEILKLLDTTQYGILIAWAQEAVRICEKSRIDPNLILEFGKETHELLGLRPPIKADFIGGTCVTQNMELIIDYVYKSRIIHAALESNSLWKHSKLIVGE